MIEPDAVTQEPSNNGNAPAVEGAASNPVTRTPALAGSNPFAKSHAEVATDKDGEEIPLPRAYQSIGSQLGLDVRAKLKGLDSTRANVVLKADDRPDSDPIKLAHLCIGDFARQCAKKLGTTGVIYVEVYAPGEPDSWGFGFEVPAQLAQAVAPRSEAEAIRAMLENHSRQVAAMIENAKLDNFLAGGGGNRGGGDDIRDRLLNKFIENMGQGGGASSDVATMFAGFAEGVKVMGEAQRANVDSMLATRDSLNKLGGGGEAKASEFKEFADAIDLKGVVGDVRGVVRQKMLGTGGAAQKEPTAGGVKNNPFSNLGNKDAS